MTKRLKFNQNVVHLEKEKNMNDNLACLFKNIANNLEYHNNKDFQQTRIDYATEHTYSKQIENISKLIV